MRLISRLRQSYAPDVTRDRRESHLSRADLRPIDGGRRRVGRRTGRAGCARRPLTGRRCSTDVAHVAAGAIVGVLAAVDYLAHLLAWPADRCRSRSPAACRPDRSAGCAAPIRPSERRAFRAPHPSTVPASSPIRNDPPPSSRSRRSYSYAMYPPDVRSLDVSSNCNGSKPARRIGRGAWASTIAMSGSTAQHRRDHRANAPNDAGCLIHPVAHRVLHALCRLVDPIHGPADRVIDPLGLLAHAGRHGLDVTENRFDFLTQRRDLPQLRGRSRAA